MAFKSLANLQGRFKKKRVEKGVNLSLICYISNI